MNERSQAELFFAALFDFALDVGQRFYIWKKGGEPRWFDDTQKAAEDAKRRGTEVYFGLGTTTKPPEEGRGTKESVEGIVCLRADFDFAGKGHTTKKKYPTDLAAARRILT